MFTKIISLTPATIPAQLIHLVQTPPLHNCKQLVPGTKLVPTEAAAEIVVFKILIKDATEAICIGMTRAETRAAFHNIAQTGAREAHAKIIIRTARKIHISSATAATYIGMTRAETGKAHPNIAQTDVIKIHVQTTTTIAALIPIRVV
jgi:hypothetical protein